MVRISENTKSTVSKTEGELDVMSYAVLSFGKDIKNTNSTVSKTESVLDETRAVATSSNVLTVVH